jgi:type IV pilus assembly protein PilN
MIEDKDNNNQNSELKTESELDSNNIENSNDGFLDQKSEIQNNQSEIVNSYDLSENLDDKNNTKKDILESTENRIIHKKDGRLHIYVRQDKYKGELKSKNWVGRAFLDGKQVVYSSRTQNLDEAIPILEKWYDEVTSVSKIDDENNNVNNELLTNNLKNNDQPHTQKIESQLQNDELEITENKDLKSKMFDNLKNIQLKNIFKSKNSENIENKDGSENKDIKTSATSVLKKLSNIKLGSFGKSKNNNNSNNSLSKLKNIFKSKVSKASVVGEEIAGLDITREAIRVSQVTGDKENGFILDKFSYRSLDPEKISENILDSKEYLAEEIQLALSNAKISTPNIAISIPVSSAIIRVITSPLMTDDELQKAIETDSLWENLVQLGENLNDYSIFHQIINRNEKQQTMEILFVASKLSDISSYSSLVKKAGLNPVIVDVRCFTLKNSFDNSLYKKTEVNTDSTILEIGAEENYLMIIHNDTPIITDIFLRQPEKELLSSDKITVENKEEINAVIRRYSMQLKQAINDYESKYQSKINNIKVVSSLSNIDEIIPEFRKNLPTTGLQLFDPLENVSIPTYNQEKVELKNKSILASVMGLAFRKLDIFGYYKFVTAVKNINLLPNREALKKTAKLKFISGFAFKGLASAIAAIYLILIVVSYFQIKSNNNILANSNEIQIQFDQINNEHQTFNSRLMEMNKSLELGKMVSSNQVETYVALAQVARSVPARVQFTKLTFDGTNIIKIEGVAFSDQDILNFINNLNGKKLIKQASLITMNVQSNEERSSTNTKGFQINCEIEI